MSQPGGTMPQQSGTNADGSMQQGSMPQGSMPQGTMGQPNGTMGTGTTTMGPMMNNPAPTAPASYPRCSRNVTDGCIQGSARESDTPGGRPAHHRRMRHR